MCSFGEGISMTPLQLGVAGRCDVQWRDDVLPAASDGPDEVANFQPIVKRHLDIAGLIPELSDGMAGAVQYGTARRLR